MLEELTTLLRAALAIARLIVELRATKKARRGRHAR